MPVILYIIALIIAIIIQYYVAKQFEAAAADKGYIDSKYFHLSFWLGIPGWLLVIALPDRGNRQVNHSERTVTAAADSTVSGGKCALCGNESDHLIHCEIKDQMGTRYRTICPDCMAKYNASPKSK